MSPKVATTIPTQRRHDPIAHDARRPNSVMRLRMLHAIADPHFCALEWRARSWWNHEGHAPTPHGLVESDRVVLTYPPEIVPARGVEFGRDDAGGRIPSKRFSTEQIITKLRQAEVESSRGLRPRQVCKKPGISEQTY